MKEAYAKVHDASEREQMLQEDNAAKMLQLQDNAAKMLQLQDDFSIAVLSITSHRPFLTPTLPVRLFFGAPPQDVAGETSPPFTQHSLL